MSGLIDALRAGDVGPLRRAIKKSPRAALAPELVIEAARIANEEALVLLLDAGADPNAKKRGYRPLHALIQERLHGETEGPSKKRLKCLEILLARGADPELAAAFPAARALIIAAFTGVRAFTDELVAAGGKQDIFSACALLDERAVERALKADPAAATARDGGVLTALHCCVGSKLSRTGPKEARAKLAIARKLLDAGADPNALAKSWSDEVDVAYFADGKRDQAVLELLLERGADATNALPSMLWAGHLEMAEITLARGADIDRATSNGKPLLNDLIRWGQIEPALWALAHGASHAVRDEQGWTALHQAVSRGNARMVQALVEAGADPDLADAQGRTPAGLSRASNRAKLRPLLLCARENKGTRPKGLDSPTVASKPRRSPARRSPGKS